MSHRTRYATLIDGAFAIRKLESRLHAFPTAADIESIAAAIARNESVAALSRLRVYFYHARPAAEILVNPINNERIALGKTQVHEAIVVVTGDSDLVPAFKFARRHQHRPPRPRSVRPANTAPRGASPSPIIARPTITNIRGTIWTSRH